eukprot:6491034-Pyramimonas_sp.AAC.1
MSVSGSAKHHAHYPPTQTCPSPACVTSISPDHATCGKNSPYSYHSSIGRNESGDFRNSRDNRK